MSNDINTRLQGTRDQVLAFASEIQTKLTTLERKRDQFKYSLIVLRAICVVPNERNVDIYCEIFEKIIMPTMKYSAETQEYWERYLGCLRYLHHTLSTAKYTKQQYRIYACIKSKRYQLINQDDYKYFMDIHVQHLNFQAQQQPQQQNDTKQITSALEGFSQLFEDMLQLCHSKNFKYITLLAELNKTMFSRRGSVFWKFLATLPKQISTKFFNALFTLLAANKLANNADINAQSAEYISAFTPLLQIDIIDKFLEQKLALQYLRSCRELFQGDTAIGYYIQLLYFYIKLIYTRNKVPEFRNTFLQLNRKFINFYERNSETNNAKESWYAASLVVFQPLYTVLHSNPVTSPPFDIFWQQMSTDLELCVAHLKLLLCCINQTPHIKEGRLTSICKNEKCNGIAAHMILSLAISTLNAYIAIWQQNQIANKHNNEPLNAICLEIMRHGIKVIQTEPCIDSTDVNYIVERLLKLGYLANNSVYTDFFLQLVLLLPQIRHKIGTSNWSLLMRRIYKTAEPQQAIPLHCIYIATVLLHTPNKVNNQIKVFYQTTMNCKKCITEQLAEYQSPLKVQLTKEQQRALYLEEFSIVLLYFKQNTELLNSLLRCSVSTYHYVIIARYIKTEKHVVARLKELYAMYSGVAQANVLTRLEHLLYAYLCVHQLNLLVEQQQRKFEVKDVVEKNFENSLALLDIIKIDSELERHSMAVAALRNFEAFFDKADAEHIDSNDIIIDWEFIVDDIIVVANALQMMGYITETGDAWFLLLRITKTLMDRFNYLRAITYFFANAEIYLHDARLQLDKEALQAQSIVDDVLPQLNAETFLKRNQSFVLLCLCHMANYYAKLGCLSFSNALLAQVEAVREELQERHGKIDIILVTIETIRFRLLWQQHNPKREVSNNILRIMDRILDYLRNVVYLSSVDHMICILVIIEFIEQCVECVSNRCGERISFLYSVLNIALQSGMALRAIEVLTSMLQSNLQLEYLDRAQSMLRLIDKFYCIQTNTEIQQIGTLNKLQTCKEVVEYGNYAAAANQLLHNPHGYVEPIRRESVIQLTDEFSKIQLSSNVETVQLQQFLEPTEVQHKYLCKNPQLKWCYFIVGCLRARLNFLSKDTAQLDGFYKNAAIWLKQNAAASKDLCIYYRNIRLLNAKYYVNYLRDAQKHEQAEIYLKSQLKDATIFEHTDHNYWYNLSVQLKSISHCIEKHKITSKRASTLLRRALDFNSSPEEVNEKRVLKKIDATKILKKRKPTTTTMMKSSTEIYSSDSCSDTMDLNACQIIDTIDLDDSLIVVTSNKKEEDTKASPINIDLTENSGDELTKPKKNNIGLRKARKPKNLDVVGVCEETPKHKPKTVTKLSATTKSVKQKSDVANVLTPTKKTNELPPKKSTKLTATKCLPIEQKISTPTKSTKITRSIKPKATNPVKSCSTSSSSTKNLCDKENAPLRKTRNQLRRFASEF